MSRGKISSLDIKNYLKQYEDEETAIRKMEQDFGVNCDIIKERIKYIKIIENKDE